MLVNVQEEIRFLMEDHGMTLEEAVKEVKRELEEKQSYYDKRHCRSQKSTGSKG